MRDLVEILAKALVDNPDQVKVSQTEGDRSIDISLRVAPEDMGKVIGKQGKIAKAIRTVVKAAAVKDGRRVNVDIDQ
ncbi:MAG TPA: KH domain-containing protein [Verrucomicrobiae bacterium]|nr:KH domain-containing protein [Verrucomicrobiae bacterium]